MGLAPTPHPSHFISKLNHSLDAADTTRSILKSETTEPTSFIPPAQTQGCGFTTDTSFFDWSSADSHVFAFQLLTMPTHTF
jgi:hypothetical protein